MGATIFNTISQKSKALFSRIAALSRFPFTTRETSSFHPPLQLFERYELQSDIGKRGRLGVGGFGSVWAYLDTTNQCTVAIKVLPDISDEYQWNNLNRKIAILQNCIKEDEDHGIVAIHDLIRDGDHPYLIMEYMDGGNLQNKLADQPGSKFTWPEFQPILLQIARALDHVHAHHIIHRDVKPANIMLDEDGKQAKLVDFDIAEVIQNSISIYKTRVQQKEESTIVGSYPFMAPEQFYGNTSYYSDQYSLACIAFECMEGSPAFPLSSKQLNKLEYWQKLHCEIGFNKKAKNLGPHAYAVLRKALSIEQSNRYGSCVEFVKALEEAIEKDKDPNAINVDQDDPYKTIRGQKPQSGPEKTNGSEIKPSKTKGQNAKRSDSNSEPKPNHGIRNLFILLGIIVALVGFWIFVNRPDPLPWEDIKKQWESVQPVLKESGLPVEQAIIRMDNHLKNCKIYKDNPQVLQTFQGNATTLLNRLEPISKSYKKIQDSLSENTKKQLNEKENCPDEWNIIQTLIVHCKF